MPINIQQINDEGKRESEENQKGKKTDFFFKQYMKRGEMMCVRGERWRYMCR